MKIQKINICFSANGDADFEKKAQLILKSMTGNTAFTDPIPSLVLVAAAIEKYSADLVTAATLDRTAVAIKNKSRDELDSLLRQLGMYVMYIANGDVAILTSSGFTVSKTPEPIYITNPGNINIANGVTSGEMEVSVKTVKGAKGYLHQISSQEPTSEADWVSTSSSRSKYTFKNLLAGKRYWVRIAVMGSGEQIAFSPVASQFVQ